MLPWLIFVTAIMAANGQTMLDPDSIDIGKLKSRTETSLVISLGFLYPRR